MLNIPSHMEIVEREGLIYGRDEGGNLYTPEELYDMSEKYKVEQAYLELAAERNRIRAAGTFWIR